ncbi:MAG: hydroxyacylglutathione hydrolase [Solirubrobacteraceae bacterium]|nr:fold metallo-hydrolase [Solirubrobacterales bacterium]MEA2216131.1 hydroxyacylglutathione hydrolase [Solirubrobacteraceae bacterium]
MIVERSTHPQFISNTFLVADGEGGPAFFVDAGGPVAPLIEAAERRGLEPTHVLLTHHHYDHICELDALLARWPDLKVLISSRERALLGSPADEKDGASARYDTIEAGDATSFGALSVRPLHTPGHTGGMLSFFVSGDEQPGAVFTGDTLFKDSVGGVKAPGHTTYADLRDSIMGTLMELSPETVIHPGHAADTTVGREWEQNAFIRVWRGLDPEGAEPCTALGEPATLVLLGADYDGGTKAWVRWADGADDIVPGSKVERGP